VEPHLIPACSKYEMSSTATDQCNPRVRLEQVGYVVDRINRRPAALIGEKSSPSRVRFRISASTLTTRLTTTKPRPIPRRGAPAPQKRR
jgi:hypothetical protein